MDAHVLVRRTFRERAHVRVAVAVEAAMEDLAAALGGDVETWALAGLVADLDREMVDSNPERRGAMAADMLAGEDVPEEVVAAVRGRWAADAGGRLASALAVATVASEAVLQAAAAGTGIERLGHEAIAAALSCDGRVQRALEHLEMDERRAAAICLGAVCRIRGDLGMAPGATARSAR